jgi:hypothetical protein
MLHVKDLCLCGRRMHVVNGRVTSFWADAWCDQYLLKDRFPGIQEICMERTITVAEASNLNWRFFPLGDG